VDEVELEDGAKIQPVSIIFPEGNDVPAQNQDQVQTYARNSLHLNEKVTDDVYSISTKVPSCHHSVILIECVVTM